MVVVRIELWPFGREFGKRLLGIATISNDGTGNEKYGNYNVRLSHSGKYSGRKGTWKKGSVEKHRRSLSPYHLLYKALKAALNIK